MKIPLNKLIAMSIYVLIATMHSSYAIDEQLLVVNRYRKHKITVYFQTQETDNQQIFEVFAQQRRFIAIPKNSNRIIVMINAHGNQYIKSIDLPLPNNEAILKITKHKTSGFILKKLIHWADNVKEAAWLEWIKRKLKVEND